MTHRRQEAKAKTARPIKVSNWWYAVGGLVGVAAVFVFWWFIWPLIVAIFY